MNDLPKGANTLKKVRDVLKNEIQGFNAFGLYPESIVEDAKAALMEIERLLTEMSGEDWKEYDSKNIWYAVNKNIVGWNVNE